MTDLRKMKELFVWVLIVCSLILCAQRNDHKEMESVCKLTSSGLILHSDKDFPLHLYEFMEKEFPHFVEEFEMEMEEGPEDVAEFQDEFVEFAHSMWELKKEAPEEYRMEKRIQLKEFETMELVDEILDSEQPVKKTALKKELKAQLASIFDMRQQLRKKEVEYLEEEIQELRSTLKKREQNKKVIIQKHMDDLLLDPEIYEW